MNIAFLLIAIYLKYLPIWKKYTDHSNFGLLQMKNLSCIFFLPDSIYII